MCSATPQSRRRRRAGSGRSGTARSDRPVRCSSNQVGRQPEPDRDAAHHRGGHAVAAAVSQSRIAGPRSAGSSGNRFGAVQRNAGDDPRVVGGCSSADVQALLAVGSPGRQLAADREPAPPRRARRSASRSPAWRRRAGRRTARAAASIRPSRSGSTPCPVMRKNPMSAAGLIDLAADALRRRRDRRASGATSINGRWVARGHDC